MTSHKEAFAASRSTLAAATPPGTVLIEEHDRANETSRKVYFPPPSADPRDPLNLPQWHKTAALIVVSLYAFVGNFTSSIIAPALQIWPMEFPQEQKTVPQLTYLIAVHVLFLGAGNVIWVPLSNWLGRRPVLLAATLMMTLASVWCGLATSYNSLLAARIFQGLGGAASDTVAPALIGDLYFIHQRGRAMALYTIMLCAGPIVGGIAGGYLAFLHGWRSIFLVSIALSGLCFFGVAFFVPETLFERILPLAEDLRPGSPSQTKEAHATHSETEPEPGPTYKPHTFSSTLWFKPRNNNRTLLQHFVRPWRTLTLPGVWIVMLQYSGLVGGTVTISTVGPQILAMPPYLWKEKVGLINLGGLIGALLGYLYTHFLSDRAMARGARKAAHRGTAEAEDRLPTLFLPLAIATGGFFVFGFCVQYPAPDRWVGLMFGFGMVAFGLMQVPSVGFNYLIDSYGQLAPDCFTVVTILRSIIAFAWSFFVAEWVQSRGGAEPFGIFGMLMGIFSILTVPVWIWGKRMRLATASKVQRWAL
ncbi:MFS general substrate transporter [Sarocladium strictum]